MFGPAPDGGYWLVGLKRMPAPAGALCPRALVERHALADTLANLDGKRVAFAATLSDVDTAEDFRQPAHIARERWSSQSNDVDAVSAFNPNLRGFI